MSSIVKFAASHLQINYDGSLLGKGNEKVRRSGSPLSRGLCYPSSQLRDDFALAERLP